MLDAGLPPGKTHEYDAIVPDWLVAVPAKLTDWPVVIVTLPAGLVIDPAGG